jgi:predicted nucleic acid-binding protein
MILDTTFLIDLLDNDPRAVKKSQELDARNNAIFTTTISVFELWQGVSDVKHTKKLEQINTLLDNLGLFVLDKESAKIGGKIHSELCSRGLTIQPEDSMIAGICLKHGKKILTRNIKHFSRIGSLEIETY